jgi:hypothetical protein
MEGRAQQQSTNLSMTRTEPNTAQAVPARIGLAPRTSRVPRKSIFGGRMGSEDRVARREAHFS